MVALNLINFLTFLFILITVYGHPVRKFKTLKHRKRSDFFPKQLRALHNPQLFNGDIIRYPKLENRNAVAQSYWLWPNAEIPYVIDASLDSQKKIILDAMQQFNRYTCIKYRERKADDKNYVRIFKGVGCYSTIGKDDDHDEMLSLGEGCYHIGTVVHELMHALGFYHEQNRSDRDKFLEIFWENIDEQYKEEFAMMHAEDNKILTPFDYNSIMLYGPLSFSKDGHSITMKPKYQGFTMIEVYDKPGLTEFDAMAINILYQCTQK